MEFFFDGLIFHGTPDAGFKMIAGVRNGNDNLGIEKADGDFPRKLPVQGQ